jgi:hypothetical protein
MAILDEEHEAALAAEHADVGKVVVEVVAHRPPFPPRGVDCQAQGRPVLTI